MLMLVMRRFKVTVSRATKAKVCQLCGAIIQEGQLQVRIGGETNVFSAQCAIDAVKRMSNNARLTHARVVEAMQDYQRAHGNP